MVERGGTPSSDWLKTSTILSRNAQGAVIESADVDGVKTATIYDTLQIFSLATFVNAALDDSILYTSFEDYQILAWDFSPTSSGQIIKTDAFTGKNSAQLNPAGTLTRTITIAEPNRSYIFSTWAKTPKGLSDSDLQAKLTI